MSSQSNTSSTPLDVVVIGAGFAGLYALYRLRELGFRVHAFEAGSGVGGTWYWNRYPGARTDSEAEVYQYWFSDELLKDWDWKERFPAQQETEAYLNFVADRLDLRKDFTFNTRVTAAHWDESAKLWAISTNDGVSIRCQFLVACLGPLSDPQEPPFPGRENFRGTVLHTARWPREGIDLKGKRVGVVGTAATGIQVIQTIAKEVGELYVFQRTANYTIPMLNPRLDDADRARMRSRYPESRKRVFDTFVGFHFDLETRGWSQVSAADRQEILEELWNQGSLKFWAANFGEIMVDEKINAAVSDFVRAKMRARIKKPSLAEKLLPNDHGFGTRRTPLDKGYLEAFNEDHVHLIDVKAAPIEGFTENGLRTKDANYALDVVILATGFDASTGALTRIDIRGRDKRALKEDWQRDITTAMGLQKHGYPNLFMTAAPLAPSAAFCNMPTCLQQQVDWIADCIVHVRKAGGGRSIEATAEFEANWVRHHDEIANATLIAKTPSWWNGSNVNGKPKRMLSYIGGGGVYRKACDEVAAGGYAGFAIS